MLSYLPRLQFCFFFPFLRAIFRFEHQCEMGCKKEKNAQFIHYRVTHPSHIIHFFFFFHFFFLSKMKKAEKIHEETIKYKWTLKRTKLIAINIFWKTFSFQFISTYENMNATFHLRQTPNGPSWSIVMQMQMQCSESHVCILWAQNNGQWSIEIKYDQFGKSNWLRMEVNAKSNNFIVVYCAFEYVAQEQENNTIAYNTRCTNTHSHRDTDTIKWSDKT